MIEQKLQLLLASGVITENSFKQTEALFQFLLNKKIDEQKLDIFITHMAMAFTRLEKNELVQPMNEEVVNEIKQSEQFDSCNQLFQEIQSFLQMEFPEEELGYIYLHLSQIVA